MKDKHVSIPMTILSLAIGVIVIFPIIWLVLSSFKPSGELFTYPLHMFPSTPTTEHYSSVLAGGFMGYVKNSLFLAVVGTLITLLISAMAVMRWPSTALRSSTSTSCSACSCWAP